MPTKSDEQLRAIFDEGKRELAFWEREVDALLEKYPQHFVAVDPQTEELVAVGKDLDDILDKLEDLSIPPTEVWVKYLPEQPWPLML